MRTVNNRLAAVQSANTVGDAKKTWRTPVVIIGFGCLISLMSFGPRSTLGFFLTPMSTEYHWGRDVFAFALALQNLLWGIGQPVAGMIADRFGAARVFCAGGLMFAAGFALMAHAASGPAIDVSAGVLMGFGLSGTSFMIIVATFAKLLPPEWRSTAYGFGTAAASFGQFLFSPLSVMLTDHFGWQQTLLIFSMTLLAVLPLSTALMTPRAGASSKDGGQQQSLWQALSQAFGHRSYVMLVLGFFTCGFQLAFITVHLPAYLVDRGLTATVGGWTLATIGLFNIIGSLTYGWLSDRMPKRYLLSFNYFVRALAILAFISFPLTPMSSICFGVVMGFVWLSVVPPTNGIIAVMFGTQWLGTLAGFAFLSHQIGGFLGAWLGGVLFDRFGSYDPVWWLSILLGVFSGLVNLPIVEAPAPRVVPVPA